MQLELKMFYMISKVKKDFDIVGYLPGYLELKLEDIMLEIWVCNKEGISTLILEVKDNGYFERFKKLYNLR